MDTLFEKMNQAFNTRMNEMKEEFIKQTNILSENFSECMKTTLEDKLNPIMEENKKLKNEVETLKNKIKYLDKDSRKRNVILHGIDEREENPHNLLELVLEILNKMTKEANIEDFDKWEISEVYRLGRKESKKRRPVMIKLTLAWRRLAILKNNKHFSENIYATEDFPKDILQTRNELKQKQQEEIKKGNLAIIRYDKLIIKERTNQEKGHEKRKRSPSKTPKQTHHNKAGENQTAPKKINKTNALEFMSRSRTNSQSDNNNQ